MSASVLLLLNYTCYIGHVKAAKEVTYPKHFQTSSNLVLSDGFPGVPPDYEAVMFGPYLDSRFKVKSKHEAALEKLENLLVNGKCALPSVGTNVSRR